MVRNAKEKRGKCANFNSSEMKEFNKFIDTIEVVDVSTFGKMFT